MSKHDVKETSVVDVEDHEHDPNNLPSGFLTTLTAQQSEALEGLKSKISTLPEDQQTYITNHPEGDGYLLRFLRATMAHKKTKRIFHHDKALKRLSHTVAWKLENKIVLLHTESKDNVIEVPKPENYEEINKIYPSYHFKDYKSESIVWVQRQGEFVTNIEIHKLQAHYKDHDIIDKFHKVTGYNLENIEREIAEFSKEIGKETKGYVSVADMNGLGFSAVPRIKSLLNLANMAADHYPETVKKIVIVNAPWIFKRLYAIVSPFMDKDTLSKFVIAKNVNQLRDLLDVEKLPQEYGGNLKFEVPHPLRV